MTAVVPRWATAGPSPHRSTAFRAVIALVIVSLLGAVLVVVTVVRRPDPVRPTPSGLGVSTAASFLTEVTTTDPDARAQAIGRWVVPPRIPEFVAAFDQTFADRQRARVTVVAEPRGYKIAQNGGNVLEVLVWSRVTGAGAQRSVSWEISALGVISDPGGWRVFSYDGSVYDVRPGDPRLQGFVELLPRPESG